MLAGTFGLTEVNKENARLKRLVSRLLKYAEAYENLPEMKRKSRRKASFAIWGPFLAQFRPSGVGFRRWPRSKMTVKCEHLTQNLAAKCEDLTPDLAATEARLESALKGAKAFAEGIFGLDRIGMRVNRENSRLKGLVSQSAIVCREIRRSPGIVARIAPASALALAGRGRQSCYPSRSSPLIRLRGAP